MTVTTQMINESGLWSMCRKCSGWASDGADMWRNEWLDFYGLAAILTYEPHRTYPMWLVFICISEFLSDLSISAEVWRSEDPTAKIICFVQWEDLKRKAWKPQTLWPRHFRLAWDRMLMAMMAMVWHACRWRDIQPFQPGSPAQISKALKEFQAGCCQSWLPTSKCSKRCHQMGSFEFLHLENVLTPHDLQFVLLARDLESLSWLVVSYAQWCLMMCQVAHATLHGGVWSRQRVLRWGTSEPWSSSACSLFFSPSFAATRQEYYIFTVKQ